jgi:hypothetical protein
MRIVQTFFVPSGERALGSLLAGQMAASLASGQELTADEVWDAFEAGYIDGLSPPLRTLWSRIRGGDRSPPLDLVREGLKASDADIVRIFIDVVAHLRPAAVIDNTVAIVASALDDLRRLGSRHDILCTSPLFAQLLFLGTPDPVSQLRVHQLARTSVPSLDQLDIADVVRIRQQAEAFATWRAHLSTGLEQAHRLRAELGPDVDIAAAVAESLEDARQQMLKEARNSRVLSRGNLIALITGALGGAAAGLPAGLPGSLLGTAGGVIPALSHGLLRPVRRHARLRPSPLPRLRPNPAGPDAAVSSQHQHYLNVHRPMGVPRPR